MTTAAAQSIPFTIEALHRIAPKRVLDLDGTGRWPGLLRVHVRRQKQPFSIEAIVESSIQANDFAELFRQYPTLQAVFFNGGKSEQSFRKHVFPGLTADTVTTIRYQRLPSTSPAHASLSYAQKLEQWRVVSRCTSQCIGSAD